MTESFSYYLPGGLVITYKGQPKSYLGWVADTWLGGIAAWHMWLRTAWALTSIGIWPGTAVVSQVVIEKIKSFLPPSSETIT